MEGSRSSRLRGMGRQRRAQQHGQPKSERGQSAQAFNSRLIFCKGNRQSVPALPPRGGVGSTFRAPCPRRRRGRRTGWWCRAGHSRGCAARPARGAAAGAAGCGRAPALGSSRPRTARWRGRVARGKGQRCRAPSRRTGIGRKLEGLSTVRLQAERPPDPANRRHRQAGGLRHRPQTPMRRVRRSGGKCSVDQGRDLLVTDPAGRARPRLVKQTRRLDVERTARATCRPCAW